MKKNKPYYLKYYKKFLKAGRLPDKGLCNAIPGIFEDETKIMEPTNDEILILRYDNLSCDYWASGLHYEDSMKYHTFTPLRQTIVLFCAAINNEL